MFSRIVKDLRKKRGVTQIQLAEAIGVSPGNVGDWETGKSCPSYNALIALAGFFDVSADTLLGRENERKNEVLSDREVEMLRMMRELDRRDQEDLFSLAEIKLQRKIS